MQKKSIFNYLIIVAILFFIFSIKTFAETASSTTQINAEVLTNIWYSTTTINENDSINIYAGFQNHSTKNLSLTAGFFVDDVQIGKADYVASPKSLIKLSATYTAVKGGHTAQAKILDIAEVGGSNIDKLSVDNLLAKESEKNGFNVVHQITQQEVINTAKEIVNTVADTVSKTTDSVVKNIDTQAEKLATYVESLKTPTEVSSLDSKTPTQIAQDKITGKVLGISTENTNNTQNSQQNKSFSIINILLDALAFIIRHWIWTLAVVVVVVLFFTFR